MAILILKDAEIYLHGQDISGDLNQVQIDHGAEMQDNTVFGNDTRSNKAGLMTAAASVQGFWQAGVDEIDDQMFSQVGAEDSVFSAWPEGGAATKIGYAFKSTNASYTPGGAVGDLFSFSAEINARKSRLIRATSIAQAVLSTNAQGTAYQLGAVGATEEAYAVMHVYGVSSPTTLDIFIESDDVQNFGGTPTTRFTFAQTAGVTSEIIGPLAGPITDDWWRIDHTVVGTSFTVLVGLAILPVR